MGLRFDPLAALLVESEDDRGAPTITLPMHLVQDRAHLFEWHFDDEPELQSLRAEIDGALQDLALPWFERYARLSALRTQLESDHVADWFALTPERRSCILASLEFIEGNQEAAICRLDAALRERAGALPKYRYALEDVRQRILARQTK